jgi:hypothetical protein
MSTAETAQDVNIISVILLMIYARAGKVLRVPGCGVKVTEATHD